MTQRQYHGHYQEQLHYFAHFGLEELTVDWMDGSENQVIEYDWNSKLPHRSYWMHNHFLNGRPYSGFTPASSLLNPEAFKTG